MDPALQLLIEGEPDEEVEVIIRLHQADVVPPEVRVVAQFGTVATGRLRREAIARVRRDERVASMKASTLLVAPVDDPVILSDAEEVAMPSPASDKRRPATDPATGQGVCMAVIDWGCAVDHPNFRHPDGRTRLLALWDQSAPYDLGRPNRYGYGVVHSADDINRALASPRPDVALGYQWPRSDPSRRGAHGTHVLDIAAGNGRAGTPVGVAPDADLIFVQLVNRPTPTRSNLGSSVSLLEAFDLVLQTAGSRPVCINTSMGRQMGPHDGTTLTELAFDAALNAAPGRMLCCSAGNYFDRDAHSSGRLLPGQQTTVQFVVSESDVTPNELEVWYSGRDVFSVELQSPTGARTKRIRLDDQASLHVDGREVCRLLQRTRDPNNDDNEIHVYMFAPAPAGVWNLVLVAEDVVVGSYDCWIERDATCTGCQARFDPADVVPLTTTGTICNGSRTIAVGAYNLHDSARPLASFSSSGPTRDRRVKPDLCAPGVNVLAARSTRPGEPDPPGYFTRLSGTSMASPHVAGAVVCMFEAAGRPLHVQETHNLLLRSAVPVEVDEEDANRVGSGYLDVDAALARTRAYVAAEPGRDGGPAMPLPELFESQLDPEQEPTHAGLWFATGSRPPQPPMPPVRGGNEVQALLRGGQAFPAMVDAIRSAVSREHYIYLLGWFLDVSFQLIPGQAGTTALELLDAAVGRGVQVRAMLWRRPFSSQNLAAVAAINRLTNGAAIHDDRTLNLGSHHQKLLVVKGRDGLIGFCGGVDLNPDRIHVQTGGSGSGSGGSGSGGGAVGGNGTPLHDVHCRIRGPAAYDLLQVFVQRWEDHPDHVAADKAKGQLRGRAEPVPGQVGNVEVQVGRTFGNGTRHRGIGKGGYRFAPNGEQTIRRQLLHAIDQARRFIYLEDQYLVSQEMSQALVAALPNISHLTILVTDSILLSPDECPHDLHAARRRFIAPLRAAGRAKVRIFAASPVGAPFTYVHSKAWIFDDEFAVIGSANCNRRGYTHDSEIAAAMYDPGSPSLVKQLRVDIWAAHLNLDSFLGRPLLSDGVVAGNFWLHPPAGARITPFNEAAPLTTGQSTLCRFASWDGAIDPDGS